MRSHSWRGRFYQNPERSESVFQFYEHQIRISQVILDFPRLPPTRSKSLNAGPRPESGDGRNRKSQPNGLTVPKYKQFVFIFGRNRSLKRPGPDLTISSCGTQFSCQSLVLIINILNILKIFLWQYGCTSYCHNSEAARCWEPELRHIMPAQWEPSNISSQKIDLRIWMWVLYAGEHQVRSEDV